MGDPDKIDTDNFARFLGRERSLNATNSATFPAFYCPSMKGTLISRRMIDKEARPKGAIFSLHKRQHSSLLRTKRTRTSEEKHRRL